MTRAATTADLDAIVSGYQARFIPERQHRIYAVFQEGVCPNRAAGQTKRPVNRFTRLQAA